MSRSQVPLRIRSVVLGASCFLGTLPSLADSTVIGDGRDHYTLLRQKFLNRQLFEQLEQPSQTFRLGRGFDQVALAADARIGSQQRLDAGEQSRFHGFFVFDTFAAIRPFYGFDANLNLTLYNPSASDGYRVSGAASPGGALHFYYEHQFPNAGRLHLDLWGTDLDVVTLGGGLLLEQWPNEGVVTNLAYEDLYFRYFFGGRAFWSSDDLVSYSLGAFDGKLELAFADWKFRDTDHRSQYLELSTRWPLLEHDPDEQRGAKSPGPSAHSAAPSKLQIVSELGMRLPETAPPAMAVIVPGERFEPPPGAEPRARFAALARADYIDEWQGVRWHVGYQFRWYQQGFGPREIVEAPSTTHNLPYREEAYVTNSFEYFGRSLFYEQRTHTAMLEASVPLGPYFRAFGETELIHYTAIDPATPDRPLPEPLLAEALWYRVGLKLHPWPARPHRLSGSFTNKQVSSGVATQEPLTTRFERGHFVVVEMELFL